MAVYDYPQYKYGQPLRGLEKLSHEIMVFMRGKYRLDEVPGKWYDVPCLRFRQSGKTLVTFCLYPDSFGVQTVLGKAERQKFDEMREMFPPDVLEQYDREPTHSDGKWLMLRVDSSESWETAKKLILLKKKPNRKPFPAEGAIYAKCGQRCDLCIHCIHTTDEQRALMKPNLDAMWGESDWAMRCGGCESDTCYCKDDPCPAKACAKEKGIDGCRECACFPCLKATTADHRSMLHTENHKADEITWGILPYVPWQYEKRGKLCLKSFFQVRHALRPLYDLPPEC